MFATATIFSGVRDEFSSTYAHEQRGGIPRKWTVADSAEIYGVKYWGNNYFSINDAGNVQAHPAGPDGGKIDLKELVDEVARRGIELPLLIRFTDILQEPHRRAERGLPARIAEYGYKGEYRGVYPIKVNQHRTSSRRSSSSAGRTTTASRPAPSPSCSRSWRMLDDEEALIICNGYKDEEYIETALLASKLGRTVILVVEKFTELPLIAEVAKKIGRPAALGMRAKLAARASGAGRTRAATARSSACRRARWSRRSSACAGNDLLDCFELLHFHLGCQISAIRA